IKLPLGVLLELRGSVHRLDVLPNGYRAILLGNYQPNWKNQLRMPLLQRAVARKFGRPADKVTMGVQYLDGTSLVEHQFSQRDVTNAENEFKNLSGAVEGYARKIPGLLP